MLPSLGIGVISIDDTAECEDYRFFSTITNVSIEGIGKRYTELSNGKVELSVAEAILDEISSRMEYMSLARRSIDLTILRTDKALRDTQVNMISKGHDSIDQRY